MLSKLLCVNSHKLYYGGLFFAVLATSSPVCAKLLIHSQASLEIELRGFNGLTENTFFKGNFQAGTSREIATPYQGLALLVFAGGQSYRVIMAE